VRRAQVIYHGVRHDATADGDQLRLDDGSRVAEDEVTWLPPVEPRTIFAVGLNYAKHAQEIKSATEQEPLVFLKGPNAVAGHRSSTPRPADAKFMHYECELAVVIGRTARRVPADAALAHVAGYTVANDYAIRDYLENYYRPNLRVKNRDGATLLGPWLVDAADVADPMNLELRTSVNGKVTQRGNTRDMILGVAHLIAHLSSILTLSPGDVILTGTPEGVVNVEAGDEVVTEIDGIGRLVGYIVPDAAGAIA
jgi:5-oxopent-3-ene-1,2,5-tricarboxylate decarboxylase / 2-hydroxyhepta-2,4-diene-1,7-dioate isomerase